MVKVEKKWSILRKLGEYEDKETGKKKYRSAKIGELIKFDTGNLVVKMPAHFGNELLSVLEQKEKKVDVGL